MKIIYIFQKYGQGLIESGNIVFILLGIIIVVFSFILVAVAYLFKFGFSVFRIFLDESFLFSKKGHSFLNNISSNLKDYLLLLFYWLLRFIKPLYSEVGIIDKPKINKNIFLIFKNLFISLFCYALSLVIVIISFYWLLSYVDTISIIIDFLITILGVNFSFFQNLNTAFTTSERFIYSVISVNIFNLMFIWIIRIFVFSSIFYYRYYRLKKKDKTLNLKIILENKYWLTQSNINSNNKFWHSGLFIIVFAFLILIMFFSLRKTKTIPTNLNNSKTIVQIKNGNKKKKKSIDKKKFNKTINNIIAQIKAQEYQYALQLINQTSKMEFLSKTLKKQLLDAKAFLKAKENNEALNILTKINNQ